VLFSAAAAGVGAGIGLLVVGVGAKGDAEGVRCPGDGDTCPQEAIDAIDRHNLFVPLGGALLGVGVAAAVGGVLALVLPGPETPTSSVRATWFAPWIDTQTSGVVVGGSF
jgi:hypothetical protein